MGTTSVGTNQGTITAYSTPTNTPKITLDDILNKIKNGEYKYLANARKEAGKNGIYDFNKISDAWGKYEGNVAAYSTQTTAPVEPMSTGISTGGNTNDFYKSTFNKIKEFGSISPGITSEEIDNKILGLDNLISTIYDSEDSGNDYLLRRANITRDFLMSHKERSEDVGGDYDSNSGNAQSAYDAQLKAIEEQRAYAEKLAEQARQEAIKNAYVNYDRSLSTYGQNAERLAQMGLSNSGHGDYLNGVAYSSMVGGVQDAHKTANEAVERAYYNASQQKAEAADTLYERQAAERAEKAQLLASIYSAVQSGDLSAEAAEDILSAYGIGEAGSNSKTPTTTTTTTTGSNILNNIGANKDEYTYNNAKENISADMSDETIAFIAKENGYSDTVKNKLFDYRDSLLELQLIETYRKTSDSAETDKLADVEDAKGKISTDTYQECYFYNALNLIDCVVGGTITENVALDSLERWKIGGQLNESDYYNLLKYLDEVTEASASAEKVKSKAGLWNLMKRGFTLSALGAIVELGHLAFEGSSIWNNKRNVTIDGEKYTVDVVDDYTPSNEEKELFNSIEGDKNIIRIGDEYYVKHSRTGEWAKVKKEGTDEAFFKTVNSMLKTPAIIDRPTHKKIQ